MTTAYHPVEGTVMHAKRGSLQVIFGAFPCFVRMTHRHILHFHSRTSRRTTISKRTTRTRPHVSRISYLFSQAARFASAHVSFTSYTS